MVGPSNDNLHNQLIEYVKWNSLGDYVEFTGRLSLEEWTNLSAKADVFINTTNVDNTPVSVLEAMALGLPVVSTNVGGIPYIITNGENGCLCEENDEDDMADKIEILIKSPELVRKITSNARKIIELNYDSEVVKRNWKEYIENL